MNNTPVNRRSFISSTASAAAVLATLNHQSFALEDAKRKRNIVTPRVEDGVKWFNVEDWGVEGRGWSETARYYDRLPAKAEKTVRGAVWNLSRHSAGMMTQFTTDASSLHVRYKVLSANLAMPHMPATGVSGVDFYARDSEDSGAMRWLQVVKPTAQEMKTKVIDGIDPLVNGGPRQMSAYLPLYNGVELLEIGVPEATKYFFPILPRDDKPIVFYGTSIMHGACASRPGMSISAILGRRFKLPTINLGFSGNGKMEKEVGDLLCELDAGLFAIDCLPNMNGELVSQRTGPLVKQLREQHPEVPILLVEDRANTNSRFTSGRRKHHEQNRAALRTAFDELTKSGVKNLHYLPGENLLGKDGDAATDGSHPSDLGMVRYADAYEEVINKILKG